jgi:hypothetical protein
MPTAGCWSSWTAARRGPPSSEVCSAPRRSFSGSAGTPNATSPTTCPRSNGHASGGGCARRGPPDPDRPSTSWSSSPRGLADKLPGAAASLPEGLAETLTGNRLGVGGKLLQTVESTHPVESMIEIVRDHAGRVKRWSSGEMALRWAAAGMLAARPSSAASRATRSSHTGCHARTRDRRRTRPARPRCHRLNLRSAIEAPPNDERDILRAAPGRRGPVAGPDGVPVPVAVAIPADSYRVGGRSGSVCWCRARREARLWPS